jgi:dCMP deaminase
MIVAHITALRSTCNRGPKLLLDKSRSGTGTVIVKNNRIIATGYNGSPSGEYHCDSIICNCCNKEYFFDNNIYITYFNNKNTICPNCGKSDWNGGHIIINNHCKRVIHSEHNAVLQCAFLGISCNESDFYITTKPCFDCAKMLKQINVNNIFYFSDYNNDNYVDNLLKNKLFKLNFDLKLFINNIGVL